MSIYATLWTLKFSKYDEDPLDCEWIKVRAQGVPAHIGSPTPECGYEDGDPFGDFLPPPLKTDENGDHKYMRAVVIITDRTPKGTGRSGQEYVDPLLVLAGDIYAQMTFDALYKRIYQALQSDNHG